VIFVCVGACGEGCEGLVEGVESCDLCLCARHNQKSRALATFQPVQKVLGFTYRKIILLIVLMEKTASITRGSDMVQFLLM